MKRVYALLVLSLVGCSSEPGLCELHTTTTGTGLPPGEPLPPPETPGPLPPAPPSGAEDDRKYAVSQEGEMCRCAPDTNTFGNQPCLSDAERDALDSSGSCDADFGSCEPTSPEYFPDPGAPPKKPGGGQFCCAYWVNCQYGQHPNYEYKDAHGELRCAATEVQAVKDGQGSAWDYCKETGGAIVSASTQGGCNWLPDPGAKPSIYVCNGMWTCFYYKAGVYPGKGAQLTDKKFAAGSAADALTAASYYVTTNMPGGGAGWQCASKDAKCINKSAN